MLLRALPLSAHPTTLTPTLGPLTPVTNLAHALRADPTTFARVKSVIWMGGALDHPGNTSPTAEFNCFADPYAAQAILDAVNAGAFQMILAPMISSILPTRTTPIQVSPP
jgi:inosine-uridine nucleoside N-ribohydrolase